MNRIFKSKWNACTQTWVAVSEVSCGRSKAGRTASGIASTILISLAGLTSFSAQAACSDVQGGGNYILLANGGSTCHATLNQYWGVNTAAVMDGATLIFDQPSVAVSGDGRGTTFFLGGYNSQPVGSGATVIANDLALYTTRDNVMAEGLYTYGTGNTLKVNGNFWVLAQNPNLRTLIRQWGDTIEVSKETTLEATNVRDGAYLTTGVGKFHDDVHVTVKGSGYGINQLGGDTTALTLDKNLDITTNTSTALRSGAGTFKVAGDATIATTGNGATGVNAYLSPGGGATNGGAVSLLGAGSQVQTQGMGAHGLLALDNGSIGMGAAAPAVAGATVLVAGGSVSTKGDSAYGAVAQASASNGTATALQTGGSIVTSGQVANGLIALNNNANATGVSLVTTQSGGATTVSGANSDAISAQNMGSGSATATQSGTGQAIVSGARTGIAALVAGTGNALAQQQAGGVVKTSGTGTSFGMSAQVQGVGNATATQDAGGQISVDGNLAVGIVANTTSSATGDATVNQNGTINATGTGSMGIESLSYGAGKAIVVQGTSGAVTSTGTGIVALSSVNGDVSVSQAGSVTTTEPTSFGISAATQGSGNVTVVQADTASINSAGTGIEASSAKGNASVTAGTVTAAYTGVSAAGNTGVNVTTLANKTIQSVDNGIEVIAPATAPTSVTHNGIIRSSAGNGIDTTQALGINTLTSIGDITATTAGKSAILGGTGIENVTVNGGTITGDIHLGDNTDTLVANGGTFVGGIYMGNGSDTATLNPGANLTQLTVLDGDDPRDTTAGTVNTLNLNNTLTGSSTVAGVAGNTSIVNWDAINIGDGTNAGRLNLTGDINNGWNNGSMGQMSIASTGTLALAAGTPSANVGYNVTNAGTIDLTQGASTPTGVMTLGGNYTGVSGSKLLVKSTWNNPDVQQNDKLVINGNASGSTTVSVPGGIIGDVTQSDVAKNGGWQSPVATVLGTDSGSTFTGTANTTNAGAAQLSHNGNSYYWTLQACPAGTVPQGGMCVVPTPTPAPTPAPAPVPATPIWAPAVSGYVQTPRIDREIGFAQMGQLHQRVGEQQTWSWDNCGKLCGDYKKLVGEGNKPYPIWGRMGAGTLKEQGQNRLGYKTNDSLIQFGADIDVGTGDDGSHRHSGAMLTYSHGSNTFYDKYSAANGIITDDKLAGSGSTDMLSLGGYSTWYTANGTYLDLVGNASWLRNKYASRDGVGASQHGYGIGLSAEVGRPWQLGSSNWQIEPQAQLSYQYVHLNNFNDGVRNVSGQSGGTLRGRLGARLAWNADNGQQLTNTFYGILNVLHDFNGNRSSATIGKDVITENYGRTWGEIGIGGQIPLGKSAYLFGDIRYERNLGGYKNQVFTGNNHSRDGYNGRIGVKYQW